MILVLLTSYFNLMDISLILTVVFSVLMVKQKRKQKKIKKCYLTSCQKNTKYIQEGPNKEGEFLPCGMELLLI